ncbi:MAG: translation elongation factor Ts [Bacteroidetes bacterium GWE2_29_8]|nr:MAG: translation elongation factor Ts [Bacteroidetes bacterium GWE2_29_8]OFY22402.1 MAG: translation elongation factor Ts [Bacteroidetes bacterium GWF2_29_10]
MANITAADVNKLRQITGAGMMDCKNALVESEGDIDRAIDNLRKKGQKVANKRADKEATEGCVIGKVSSDNKRGVVVAVNCETDFVAKNEEFRAFTENVADIILNNNISDIETLKQQKIGNITVGDRINELIGKIAEKIEISRFESMEADYVTFYNHNGNKITALIGFNKNVNNIGQVGKDLAMQIAAMSPIAIDKEDVSQDTINREIEIAKEQIKLEGKSEEMAEKIAIGKLNKFFNENTLLNQEFIKDNKKTIRQYLQETNNELKVVKFFRVQIGG